MKSVFRKITGSVFVALTISMSLSVQAAKGMVNPITAFDRYGRISWNDEKARLDNFAIQLTNESRSVGFIFVFNAPGMCQGEAQARGVRAKRYLVEYRHVEWNRVIWKEEGFKNELQTDLWVFEPSLQISYHYFGDFRDPLKLKRDGCQKRIEQIKHSKW